MKCGAEISDTAAFCTSCGNKISERTENDGGNVKQIETDKGIKSQNEGARENVNLLNDAPICKKPNFR